MGGPASADLAITGRTLATILERANADSTEARAARMSDDPRAMANPAFAVEVRSAGGVATGLGNAGPYTLVVDRPTGRGSRPGVQRRPAAVPRGCGMRLQRPLPRGEGAGISLTRVRVTVTVTSAGDPPAHDEIVYRVEIEGDASARGSEAAGPRASTNRGDPQLAAGTGAGHARRRAIGPGVRRPRAERAVAARPLVPPFAGDASPLGVLLDREVDLRRHHGHDDIVELLEDVDSEQSL